MKIARLLGFGQIDYPGKIAAVVLSPGCNYKCPACHSPELLKSDSEVRQGDFFKYLDQNKRWLDGVVLCGGEPTMQQGLNEFAREIKKKGYVIKLDTNGSHHSVLKELLDEKLVDYVAMDVKGPLSLYNRLAGIHVDWRDNVQKAISVVSRFPAYEYRTTVAPVIRDDEGKDISFLTPDEIAETAKMICENTEGNHHRYYLERFVPRKGGLIDKRLESFPETPLKLLEDMIPRAKTYLKNTELRT